MQCKPFVRRPVPLSDTQHNFDLIRLCFPYTLVLHSCMPENVLAELYNLRNLKLYQVQ